MGSPKNTIEINGSIFTSWHFQLGFTNYPDQSQNDTQTDNDSAIIMKLQNRKYGEYFFVIFFLVFPHFLSSSHFSYLFFPFALFFSFFPLFLFLSLFFSTQMSFIFGSVFANNLWKKNILVWNGIFFTFGKCERTLKFKMIMFACFYIIS